MKNMLRNAWVWWTGELGSMVPAWLRRLGRGQRPVVAVQLWPDHLIIGRRGHEGDDDTLRVDVADLEPSAQRAAVSKAIARVRSGGLATTVLIPEERVLHKTVNLPAVAAENLGEVLGYEMDRHTPFSRDEVRYDFRLLSTDPETSQIKVDLAVVPQTVVDEATERMAQWGIPPSPIGFARDWADPDRDFFFVSGTPARSGRHAGAFVTSLLAVVAVALGVAVGYVSLERVRAEAAHQTEILERLKKQARESSGLQAQIDALTKERQFGSTKKTERLPAVTVIDRVSKLLPDDIWLYQFQLTGNEAQIHGYSPDASKIVALIEKSPYFHNAIFRSRVTRDSRSGAQRFHISFTVRVGE